MNKKVYIVTSGEYSAYGIEAVFLDKSSAEKYCAAQSDSNWWRDYRIEEYDIGYIEGEENYKKMISLTMDDNGYIASDISEKYTYSKYTRSCKMVEKYDFPNNQRGYGKSYLFSKTFDDDIQKYNIDFTVPKDEDLTTEQIEKIARDILLEYKYNSRF